MSDDEGEILPPIRTTNAQHSLSTFRPPAVGGPIAKWLYHFQTQTVYKQTELFNALVSLSEAQQRAVRAKVDLEVSLVRLEFLDELRQLERERIKAEIQVGRDTLTADLLRSGVNLQEMIQHAQSVFHPPKPEPKPERPDPVKSRIDATLHGGAYARYTEEQIENLIRQYGGEDKLPDELRERIANARRHAARADEGRG